MFWMSLILWKLKELYVYIVDLVFHLALPAKSQVIVKRSVGPWPVWAITPTCIMLYCPSGRLYNVILPLR